MIDLAGMTIKTTYEPLNFTSVRDFDWSAVDDDTYDGSEDAGCPIGRGATEAAAIADLIIESQRFHDQYDRDLAWRYRLARLRDDEPCAEADDAAPLADWVA